MDILFVNKIPLLFTLPRKIYFTDKIPLPTQKSIYAFKYFWRIYVLCLRCGFRITRVHAGEYFTPVRKIVSEMSSALIVKFISANKHVPEMEKRIWVVKEWFRAIRHRLAFIRLPIMLTTNMALNNANLLGYFLSTSRR